MAQKINFWTGKSAKNVISRKKNDLFYFTSFFARTYLNFLARCGGTSIAQGVNSKGKMRFLGLKLSKFSPNKNLPRRGRAGQFLPFLALRRGDNFSGREREVRSRNDFFEAQLEMGPKPFENRKLQGFLQPPYPWKLRRKSKRRHWCWFC